MPCCRMLCGSTRLPSRWFQIQGFPCPSFGWAWIADIFALFLFLPLRMRRRSCCCCLMLHIPSPGYSRSNWNLNISSDLCMQKPVKSGGYTYVFWTDYLPSSGADVDRRRSSKIGYSRAIWRALNLRPVIAIVATRHRAIQSENLQDAF